LGLQYIYTWKYQKETPRISYLYLKQTKMSFFKKSFLFCKIGEQEGGTGPAGGEDCHPWEGGGVRKRG
jgi:hypothetical protein